MPPAPVGAHYQEKSLMCVLIPFSGDKQHRVPAADVDGSMQNALLAIARNRHPALLSDAAIATVERRRFRDDGFIQHQNNRPLSRPEATF